MSLEYLLTFAVVAILLCCWLAFLQRRRHKRIAAERMERNRHPVRVSNLYNK